MPDLAGAIGSSIEESGAVRESASEDVRRARARVRTLEGRIRGILKVGTGGAQAVGRRSLTAQQAAAPTWVFVENALRFLLPPPHSLAHARSAPVAPFAPRRATRAR